MIYKGPHFQDEVHPCLAGKIRTKFQAYQIQYLSLKVAKMSCATEFKLLCSLKIINFNILWHLRSNAGFFSKVKVLNLPQNRKTRVMLLFRRLCKIPAGEHKRNK